MVRVSIVSNIATSGRISILRRIWIKNVENVKFAIITMRRCKKKILEDMSDITPVNARFPFYVEIKECSVLLG
jgi:hypothetical protein